MKPTVQTLNRFLFLTGNEDFTIRKAAVAKIVRARGRRFFVRICGRYGISGHYLGYIACVECQKQWYGDNSKRGPYPEIKPFSSAYTIAVVFFKGTRLWVDDTSLPAKTKREGKII